VTPARFSDFVGIDWSGAVGERHRGIAIAHASSDGAAPRLCGEGRRWSRADVLQFIRSELSAGTLVGLDLGTSLPFVDCGVYFPGCEASPPDAKSLWALVDEISGRDEHFAVTSFADHDAFAPYFRRHGGREGASFRCDGAAHGRGRFRVTELRQAEMGCRPYSNFNLVGAAQVGKASLTGMRLLHALGGTIPVWPFDPIPDSGPVIVEIYTTLAAIAAGRKASASKMRTMEELNTALGELASPPVPGRGPIDDHSADALLAAAWLRASAGRLDLWDPPGLTDLIARTEGWTFGAA
jgi:hypothetical protein